MPFVEKKYRIKAEKNTVVLPVYPWVVTVH
jgi:hypothetical protein